MRGTFDSLSFRFSDILPLAASEETHSVWRFEAAYLVTAGTSICGAVFFLSAFGVIALVCHRPSKGVSRG
jgi:hypothetical protein